MSVQPYYSKDGNDVCLLVEDQHFYSLKRLLSRESDYFRVMFDRSYNFIESQKNMDFPIPIYGVPASVFRWLLHYVHFRKINLKNVEELWSLYGYSHYFGMDGFSGAIQKCLSASLREETVCLLWNRARKANAECLSNMCKQYFMDNFARVVRTQGFFFLDKEALRESLVCGNIRAEASEVLSALKAWAGFSLISESKSYSEEAVMSCISDMLPPYTLFCHENKLTALQCYKMNSIFV
eukprot:TRINITY_DN4138_c0_g2_i1.p1 TRINITY_DN4138_c0_g2~~TRINITY_DN4138_c0_g2_i1.p1  ORF type:complete len:238 (-),score=16.29 TRINITY_DN4138_c0_g2_i1:42-755(-)